MESTLERQLCDKVKKRKGWCIKLIGFKGIPDRLVLLPYGKVGFIETKNGLKGRVSKIQTRRIAQLNKLGFYAKVLRNSSEIDEVLDEICSA